MRKFYAGIGSRETPEHILKIMTQVAEKLEKQGWTLRSGGATGADSAFQKGVTNYDQIFITEKTKIMNKNKKGIVIKDKKIISDAMYMIHSLQLHEKWEFLINNPTQNETVALHTRNIFQILGEDLKTPVKMVVCWTKDGAKTLEETSANTGGTRTAIRLANKMGIPIFNLKNEEDLNKILKFIIDSPTNQNKKKSKLKP